MELSSGVKPVSLNLFLSCSLKIFDPLLFHDPGLYQLSNPSVQNQPTPEYQRYPAQIISMPGEKSLPPAKMNPAFEGRFFPPGSLGDNRASGIDERRDSVIGNSNKIAPVFDGTNRAEIEVVPVARCIFPPAVVGDHADKARFFGQIAGAVRAEYGFKADDRHDG